MYQMDGKVAIVTGGAAGIGYAIAERLLEENVIVAICDIAEERLAKAAETLSAKGTVYYEVLDISKYDDVLAFGKNVHDKFGHIDFLMNNAAIIKDAQFYKMDIENFRKVIEVDLMGTVYMCKACVPYMMEQHYGKIVNCSSVAAFSGNFGQTNYSAAKGAVVSMTKTMGKELLKHGINVNVIIPGACMTDMVMQIHEEIREKKAQTLPARRWGTPRELANAYVFLASEQATWISGTSLLVDGGYL